MKHICPKGYQSELTLLETQQAITGKSVRELRWLV